MELQQVPALNIAAIIFSLIVSVFLPVALCLFSYRKWHAKLSCFVVGFVTFFVSALVLEQLLHMLVLGVLAPSLSKNVMLYAAYGAAAATLFEECGRLVAFKILMKNRASTPNAFMYGVGHGGAEAILLVGVTMINNLSAAIMINSGQMQTSLSQMDAASQQSALQMLSPLWSAPASQYLLGGLERFPAIALQIALSLLVFYAVKTGAKQFFFLAMFFHFAADFVTVIAASFLPLALAEGLIVLVVFICCYTVFKIYRSHASA